MIQYNPKDWFTFIFRAHKADTVRILAKLMLALAAYCLLVAWLEKEVFKLTDSNLVKNLPLLHTLLGSVISLLLVFRTNTAYDRWWEGRKLLGSLTNTSRALAIKVNAYLQGQAHAERRAYFKTAIPFFASSLRTHLLKQSTAEELFSEDVHHHVINNFDKEAHIPNQVCNSLVMQITEAYKAGSITDIQMVNLNADVQEFVNICGACERIRNTPIPFSYSAFLKKFIFFYIMTMPFGFVFSLGYLCVPVVVFIFYVLASLELIAEEIEEPFGDDVNDLPVGLIAANIKKHVEEIL
jgi:ion channel-forming bestrophin family protein